MIQMDWNEVARIDIRGNRIGAKELRGAPLVYVKSGDGDGTYSTFELVHDGEIVGLECDFD